VTTAKRTRPTIWMEPTQTSSPVNLARASPARLASRSIRLAPPSSAPSVDLVERTASRAFKPNEQPTLSARGSAIAIMAFARTTKSTNCASGKINRTAGPTGSPRNTVIHRTTWPQMSGRATLKTTSTRKTTTCIHTRSEIRISGRITASSKGEGMSCPILSYPILSSKRQCEGTVQKHREKLDGRVQETTHGSQASGDSVAQEREAALQAFSSGGEGTKTSFRLPGGGRCLGCKLRSSWQRMISIRTSSFSASELDFQAAVLLHIANRSSASSALAWANWNVKQRSTSQPNTVFC
jgi:hypothetical protein